MSTSFGICQLCQQKKELVGKSHIIPKQFFIDFTKRIAQLSSNQPRGESVMKEYRLNAKPQQLQNGFHCSDILCGSCEQLLGRFDKYGQNLLLKNTLLLSCQLENGQDFCIKEFNLDVDYMKLKLFFMAILWRASVAKNKVNFFKKVHIEKESEERLRIMLLENNPGNEDDFSILLFKYEGEDIEVLNIPEPAPINHGDLNLVESYKFIIGNFGFTIKVDQQPLSIELKEYILRPNQPLKLIIQNYRSTHVYKAVLESVLDFGQN